MLLLYSRTGSLPMGKLGSRLQVHQSSITSLIDRLESAGLVQRSAHPNDRRAILATITGAGRELASAATERLHAISFGTDPLGPTELNGLTATLRAFRHGAGDFDG